VSKSARAVEVLPLIDGAPEAFRSVAPRQLWRLAPRRTRTLIFGGWLLSMVCSIGLGLMTVIQRWSGLPLSFGGVDIYITVYPPLLICLWWTLNFGWWWGAIPAYLATLSLALYAGMPWAWALLFACANPLGFAVLVLGYRGIAVSRSLRTLESLLVYAQLAFVASVFGSAGALVWCYTNRIDTTAVLAIWQGWWLGSFLQRVLLAGPLLYASGPAIMRWQLRHPAYLSQDATQARRRVLRLIAVMLLGVLAYGFVTIGLGSGRVGRAIALGDGAAIFQAAEIMRATSWVFFWIFAIIILFLVFFGYRLFMRWQSLSSELIRKLEQANAELAVMARTDALSGLNNRRVSEQYMTEQWKRALRGEPSGLLMIDIDHFKSINDQYGHDAGDAVIRALAGQLRAQLRGIDIAGRWGGEEFVVVLPNTDLEGLRTLAERLREQVGRTPVPYGKLEISYSISVGAGLIAADDHSAEAALKRVDQALYAAKQQGRNRVVVAEGP
jgi:diguanylate cyclase (GGDEF)-like protein